MERVEVRKRWPDRSSLRRPSTSRSRAGATDRLIVDTASCSRRRTATGVQGLPLLDGPDDRLADVIAFYADAARFAGSGLQSSTR